MKLELRKLLQMLGVLQPEKFFTSEEATFCPSRWPQRRSRRF